MFKPLLMAALLTIPLCAAPAADETEWTKSYTVGSQPEIRVETGDGGVTVRTWDQNRIDVRVTSKGWEQDELRIIESQTGDAVSVQVKLPKMQFNWGTSNRWVRVEVAVPQNTRTTVNTGDGGIRVAGVHNELRLHTGDGGIEADGVAGALEASTGDGGIRVRGKFTSLTLKTGDGGIEADVEPGSKPSVPWRVETGDGRVVVRLAPDIAVDLDVRTGDGGINVDFPLTLPAGKFSENQLKGRINAGGPTLTVRTGDGGIQISRL
jgi:DUF4097 and DUF4098 domain-containing protein YvlB